MRNHLGLNKRSAISKFFFLHEVIFSFPKNYILMLFRISSVIHQSNCLLLVKKLSHQIDGLAQDCINSSADCSLALSHWDELGLSKSHDIRGIIRPHWTPGLDLNFQGNLSRRTSEIEKSPVLHEMTPVRTIIFLIIFLIIDLSYQTSVIIIQPVRGAIFLNFYLSGTVGQS